jgi:large subunit ribosomal protein L9
MIEVILLEKIGRLGQIGQTVKVKPGFARNYLLPRNKALRATKDNMAYFESQRASIEAANADARAKAEAHGKQLNGKVFTVIRQASEVGHLFGSVTIRDVAEQLKNAGFETERQNILLAAPIKELGLTKIDVRLHAEVNVTITINIARTEDEAKVQEKTGKAVKLSNQKEDDAAAKEQAAAQAQAMFDKPEGEAEAEAAPAEEAKKA